MTERQAQLNSELSPERCVAALRYVAELFGTTLSGGPVLYTAQISPAASSPQLIAELGAQPPQIDETLTLRIAVGGGATTIVQVESVVPLYYLTGAMGFDSDCVSSFVATFDATLRADARNSRRPTFPAPPRPPQ